MADPRNSQSTSLHYMAQKGIIKVYLAVEPLDYFEPKYAEEIKYALSF